MQTISRSQFWMIQAWASLFISLTAVASGFLTLSANPLFQSLFGVRVALAARATAKVMKERRIR
ncbi:hypothetical protein IQ266_26945 [filamentous cyanobacterium LEGE 11480]|uniref:Uncharacterized protein n=1 Tax=Romeriopsis navalis LEGE 11480 TaxID=2777977 RepID=A0A928Z6V2_9CYAN|nr:hypothetical protein [Romeriopsis navalis]MBE9033377.1 hypothetical protein [Romeriopsis navalis LEGE 11480]